MIVESAPAKINLYLHIGPKRRDGLHDLASLFAFAEGGDVIRCEEANELSLEITGPFAQALAGARAEDNLIWRAATALQDFQGDRRGAAITLEKNLPIAAGVGGGSADAAAALRALIRLWHVDISAVALEHLAFSLGADVPACLARAPVNVTGAGERLQKGPRLPPLWCCLVNPRVAMPTGPIFRAFDAANPSPPAPETIAPGNVDYASLKSLLLKTRNDLEPFARKKAPVIHDVLTMLGETPGALIARMSGSGATCFALFSSAGAAARAKRNAEARGWWAMASALHVR